MHKQWADDKRESIEKKKRKDLEGVHKKWADDKSKSRDKLKNKSEGQLPRRQRYFDAVRDGLIYSCVCCKRRKFRKSVYVYRTDDPEIAEVVKSGAIGELNPRQQVGGGILFLL